MVEPHNDKIEMHLSKQGRENTKNKKAKESKK